MSKPTDQINRREIYLQAIASGNFESLPEPLTREEAYLKYIAENSGGGVTDYADLENKPSIEGTTLLGDKTLSDIGVTQAIADAISNFKRYPTANAAKLAAKRMTFMSPSGTVYNTITDEMKAGFLNKSYDGWELGQVLKDTDTGLGWTVVDFDELNGCVVLACFDIPTEYNYAHAQSFWAGTILGDDPTAFQAWTQALHASIRNVIGEDIYVDPILNASYVPGVSTVEQICAKTSNINFFVPNNILNGGRFKVANGVLFAKTKNLFQNFDVTYGVSSFVNDTSNFLGAAMTRINDNPVADAQATKFDNYPLDTTKRTFALFKNPVMQQLLLNDVKLLNDIVMNNTGIFAMMYSNTDKALVHGRGNSNAIKMIPCLFVR